MCWGLEATKLRALLRNLSLWKPGTLCLQRQVAGRTRHPVLLSWVDRTIESCGIGGAFWLGLPLQSLCFRDSSLMLFFVLTSVCERVKEV